MKRYRDDTWKVNPVGQTCWYAQWMGGPTLSKVTKVPCPDGKARTAFICGEPCTFFSVPAYVHDKSKRVVGWLSWDDDGTAVFHSNRMVKA
jgi:hypothetical protein